MDEITTLVSKAAAAILAFDSSAVAKRIKSDLSPVTAADDAAQSVILEGLSRLLPGVPVVSEEASGPKPTLELGATFVLVDPLDGTREFLAGRNEFTVNVAIVTQGRPVFGCIAAPVLGLIWRGAAGQGAERLELPAGADSHACRSRTPIRTRQSSERGLVIAVSRSHFDSQTERFLTHFPYAKRIVCGSSLKFCRVAEGSVDLYPRLAPTREWDVAAGHAIIAAAGGTVATLSGEPLAYGRWADDFRVLGFVAYGDPVTTERISHLACMA
jgi:3'(2'), 5'-bisphosphate nucleotidase